MPADPPAALRARGRSGEVLRSARCPSTPACSDSKWGLATDLDAGAQAPPAAGPPEVPVFALATVACTLAGFVLASALGISPAWAALAGAVVLASGPAASARPAASS